MSSSFSPEGCSLFSTHFICTDDPTRSSLESFWTSVHHFEDKTLSQDVTAKSLGLIPWTTAWLSLSSPFPSPVWGCICCIMSLGFADAFPSPRIFLFLPEGWGGSLSHSLWQLKCLDSFQDSFEIMFFPAHCTWYLLTSCTAVYYNDY